MELENFSSASQINVDDKGDMEFGFLVYEASCVLDQ